MPRTIRAPRGTELMCKGWLQEAAAPRRAGRGTDSPRDREGDEDALQLFIQRTHPEDVLLPGHGVDQRSGAEEEQGLEERVGEYVEEAGGKEPDPDRGELVQQVRPAQAVGGAQIELDAGRGRLWPQPRRTLPPGDIARQWHLRGIVGHRPDRSNIQ